MALCACEESPDPVIPDGAGGVDTFLVGPDVEGPGDSDIVGAQADAAQAVDATGQGDAQPAPDTAPAAEDVGTVEDALVVDPDDAVEAAPDVEPDVPDEPDVVLEPDVENPGELPSASGCPSGSSWFLFDLGSKWMHPGRACIECHAKKGPDFAFGGTVFAGDHIADECNPAGLGQPSPTQGIEVVLTGTDGAVLSATTNEVGNFYVEGALAGKLALPYTAVIKQGGKSREMLSPQTNGDCNSCHTVQGSSGAPGRIVVPL